MAKILLLDIETAPNKAYVWRFFKENVGANQIIEHSEMLSFACKWLGKKRIYYFDVQGRDEAKLLALLVGFLDEADVVVAHNGNRFDLPKVRGRCLAYEIPPPSPYFQIDTYRVAAKEFGFESNSLDYLCRVLLNEQKDTHNKFPGFELWLQCLNGNKEAWKEMKLYNIDDLMKLERLYIRMRPYIRNHPSVAVREESDEVLCPKCGSGDSQKRGFYFTNSGKYQRYQCNACGGWHRTRYTQYPADKRKFLTVNTR